MQRDGTDKIQHFKVLGVPVHAVQIPVVIRTMEDWVKSRAGCKFIAVTGMHGVTEAQNSPEFKEVLRQADLVVPDGMPLVWLGRGARFGLPRRVYGPELMESFCRSSGSEFNHFFYGGGPGTAETVARTLQERYGIRIAGTLTPPFRPLTEEEDRAMLRVINESGPDIIWVGLSTPKQELWMHEHADRLQVPVAVGVGAAFDLVPGLKKSAPKWMQEHGLEWLFRLVSEPRRLWRRYLVGGTRFAYWVLLERLGLRSFD